MKATGFRKFNCNPHVVTQLLLHYLKQRIIGAKLRNYSLIAD